MQKHTFHCLSGHEFQGWYRSSAECQAHIASGAVCCPVCGSLQISQSARPESFSLDVAETDAKAGAVSDSQAAELLDSLISSAKKVARNQFQERQQWAVGGRRTEIDLYRRIGINARS